MAVEPVARFWAKVEKSADCWLYRGHILRDGYGQFDRQRVHRVAWELTHGPIPQDVLCLHRCDTRACVRPSHLFLGSGADNMADMVQKGRAITGSRSWLSKHGRRASPGADHHMAKLTAAQVRQIRRLYKPNPGRRPRRASQHALAQRFGVSQQQIGRIVNRRRWAASQ